MRIISYNINGIRAAIKKGFLDWLNTESPDVICLQEIKAQTDQFNTSLFEELGYHCFWYPAEKRGYSGVAILSKHKPKNIVWGCGNNQIDSEGRVLKLEFESIHVFSCYFPSGSSGIIRQNFKMQFLKTFYSFIKKNNRNNNFLISGDFNICHKEIDIHNPVANKHTSGFLPEEREWMTDFLNLGFVDTFRKLNKEPHHYSWWSYRANARNNNKGWRIDYHILSDKLKNNIRSVKILSNVKHSDHCPILLDLDLNQGHGTV